MAELTFPIQGLNKGTPASKQPAGTSRDLSNVRPYYDGRAVGGQRPGLDKVFDDQIGGDSEPIVWLGSVTTTTGGLSEQEQDAYTTGDTSTDSVNAAATWLGQSFTANKTYYATSVRVKCYRVGSPGNITVALRATDGSGLPTGSDLASITVASTAVLTSTSWITFRFSTAYQLTSGTKYTWYMKIASGNSTNRIDIRVDDATLPLPTYAGGNSVSSSDSGSSWSNISDSDYAFAVYGQVSPIAEQQFSKQLVAVGNNEVWREASVGVMSEVSAANGGIDTTLYLTGTEAYSKIFIANRTNLKVLDFLNKKIATNDIGANPPDFQTVLTGGTSSATVVVDYITTLSGACTVYGTRTSDTTFVNGETVTGTDDDGNAISFVLNADEVTGPHWYTWTVFGGDATFGSLPDQSILSCNYRGRVVLSGDGDYPHQWYMSRQGNPWDYNYIANDAQAPVAGGNADAGEIGDTVTALIPYKDDYLIFGCASTMWVLSGDAAEGGSINELTLTTGMLGAKAWCWDKNDSLYMLGTTGILRIPPGFGGLENLTEQTYPDFIKDLAYDVSLHRVVMGYDRQRHGIRIAKTTLTDGTNSCWWYDLRTGGLFPETYPEECGSFCMFWYESVDPAYTGLLSGSFDGYIRAADDDAKDDDIGGSDEAISSYVTWGPLLLGEEDREGEIYTVAGELTGGASGGSVTDSNDVTFKVFTDRSADGCEEKFVANSSPKVSGTLSAGGRPRGGHKKKKIRGVYAGIRLENTTTAQTWGLEKLYVRSKQKGRIK